MRSGFTSFATDGTFQDLIIGFFLLLQNCIKKSSGRCTWAIAAPSLDTCQNQCSRSPPVSPRLVSHAVVEKNRNDGLSYSSLCHEEEDSAWEWVLFVEIERDLKNDSGPLLYCSASVGKGRIGMWLLPVRLKGDLSILARPQVKLTIS